MPHLKPTLSVRPSFDGRRLRQLRLSRSLSARQLAERVGASPRQIWRLEANARPNVRAVTLARIALALQTSIDYLLGLTDELKPYPSRVR